MSSEETLSPEAADLFGVVARRYSEGLTEEELREVRKRLEGVAERSRLLSSVKVDDAIEPAAVFTPFRGQE